MIALFTLLLADPSLAAPEAPAAAARPARSAAEYNDLISVEIDQMLVAATQMWEVALSGATADGVLDQGVALLQESKARLQALPGWNGDTSLRDAAIAALDWLIGAFQTEARALVAAASKEIPSNADLAEVEKHWGALIDGADAQDQALARAQERFARTHGFILVEGEHPPAPPSFSAPGMPPEGSRLPADVFVGMSVRYQGGLVGIQNRMVDALNRFFDTVNGARGNYDGIRREALATVQAELKRAREVGDWQGDASLRDALVSYGEALVQVLDKDFAAFAVAKDKVRVKSAELEAANAGLDAGNARLAAADPAFQAAMEAFSQRWAIDAYAAWLESQTP